MIKFFRKIRHQLLAQNRFSKYLLYAVGEVALVVIGILIALSLNNKNENKKLVVQEVKILKEINSELIDAVEDLKDDIEDLERNVKSAEIIHNSILSKESYNDSLRKHYYLSIDNETFTAKQSAFESLQSVGIALISNDSIRQEITLTYLYIKQITNEVSDVYKITDELEALLNPHLMVDREMLITDPYLTNKPWWLASRGVPFKFINYKSFLKDESFLFTFTRSIQLRHFQIYIYKAFQKGIEKVIADIEEELKTLEIK